MADERTAVNKLQVRSEAIREAESTSVSWQRRADRTANTRGRSAKGASSSGDENQPDEAAPSGRALLPLV